MRSRGWLGGVMTIVGLLLVGMVQPQAAHADPVGDADPVPAVATLIQTGVPDYDTNGAVWATDTVQYTYVLTRSADTSGDGFAYSYTGRRYASGTYQAPLSTPGPDPDSPRCFLAGDDPFFYGWSSYAFNTDSPTFAAKDTDRLAYDETADQQAVLQDEFLGGIAAAIVDGGGTDYTRVYYDECLPLFLTAGSSPQLDPAEYAAPQTTAQTADERGGIIVSDTVPGTWAVDGQRVTADGSSGAQALPAEPGSYDVVFTPAEGVTVDPQSVEDGDVGFDGVRGSHGAMIGLDGSVSFTVTVAPYAPVITGAAKVGSTLTANPGDWNGMPLGYRWYADGAAIPGATAGTLELTAAQQGMAITVEVTGSATGHAPVSATSDPTAAVGAGTLTAATPTISGTPKVGATLTAKPGTWTAGTSFSYQWYAGSSTISGATKSSYAVPAAYLGKTLKVTVTGRLAGYTTAARTSAATKAAVVGTLTAPVPTVSGIAAVGQRLTARPGSWTSGTAFSYQWYASGAAISKATASTFKPTAAQKGKAITVRVTGKKTGYTTVAKTSKGTGKVTAGVVTGPTPTISGTLKVGATLTAKPGAWSSGSRLAYQWYAGGAPISKATKTTLALGSAQLGKAITVKVSGSRSGYTSSSKTSTVSKAVAAGTLTAPTPTISGTAANGQTLTAKPGSWTSGTALSYQWYAAGISIAGATKSTLKLAAAQEGLTITVGVTGKKPGYTTAIKKSAATGRVTLGRVAGPTPTISGSAKVGAALTAKPGTWTTGSTLAYQWYAGSAKIAGATKQTFTPAPSQYQKTIMVKVTGTKSGWTGTTTSSKATGKVAAGTLAATTPTVGGTLLVGATLTASHGGWTSGTTLKYQWYRNGAKISGAVGATYRLVAADAPYPITVTVTGAKTGYTTVARTSTATGRVSPGDSVNCSSFATHAQAQAWFAKYFPYFGDVARLDSDNDGVACETLR